MELDESITSTVATENSFTRMVRDAKARQLQETPRPEDIFTRMMREAKARHLEERQRAASSPASSTAVDNVFGIPEVAEMIFLACRIYDLLINCQRVSKQWRAIIASSTRLQQALFFQPLPGYRIEYLWEETDFGGQSGYVADAVQVCREPEHFAVDDKEWEEDPCAGYTERPTDDERRRWVEEERTLTFANPFLNLTFRNRLSGHAPEMYLKDMAADREWRQKAIQNPLASWRFMLACQPPLTNAEFAPITSYAYESDLVVSRASGLLLEEMCRDGTRHYENTAAAVTAMVPVVYAKDVIRKNYKKGDLGFNEYDLDWGFWGVER